MLTISEIINATKKTHPKVWKNKKDVAVYYTTVKAWTATDKTKMRTVRAKAIDRSKIGSGRNHYIEIDFYGRGKNPKAWVTCDCEYFFFHCAWALWKKDSSDAQTGLPGYSEVGWAPKITNPRSAPRACKHIIRALTGEAASLTPGYKSGRRDRTK
jgi:hypothetical protein